MASATHRLFDGNVFGKDKRWKVSSKVIPAVLFTSSSLVPSRWLHTTVPTRLLQRLIQIELIFTRFLALRSREDNLTSIHPHRQAG